MQMIFTCIFISYLIFDEDIDKKSAMAYPKLYSSLQREMNSTQTHFSFGFGRLYIKVRLFLYYLFYSSIRVMYNSKLYGFSILIITQYFMSLSELHHLSSIYLPFQKKTSESS